MSPRARFRCGWPVLILMVVLRTPSAAGDLVVDLAIPGADGRSAVHKDAMRGWIAWLDAQGVPVSRCGISLAQGTIVLDLEDESQLQPLLDAGFSLVKRLEGRPLAGGARTDSQYFDPTEIELMLNQVALDHPAITEVFVVGTTFGGQNIYGIEISDQPGIVQDEPAIQFNGQHHAREVATSHVVMDVVNTLTDGYGVDSLITDWVNNYTTVCVPMVNPDGVQFVFDVYSLWRKNRQCYPPDCSDCLGVDLNRNYPYRWGPNRCGSTSSCSGDTYKGPEKASEEETMHMIALAEQYHFVMATSYHAYGRFIDYPYACSTGTVGSIMPEHDVIDEMMNGVADAIDMVDSIPRYTVYSPASAGALSGDDTSWYYAAQGTYPFIIEVGTAFEPVFAQVQGIVDRNRAGWQYMYERLGGARIDVHVRDACTDEPLEADVALIDYVFDTGESPRTTFLPYGRWSFVVVANDTYTVRVSKEGYVTQQKFVTVGTDPAAVDFAMEPTAGCPVAPVPAASQWGIAVMALAVLTLASILLRSRSSRSVSVQRV